MRSFTSALVGAAVATIVVSGSLAIAAIPDSTTKVITGCYKKISGELRVIDKTAKGACNVKTEVELGWNQQGVKGDPGSAGLNGLPGVPGKDGGGASVMHDATGAVVGTPIYPTLDLFWTGQYVVRYDLKSGKLVRDPITTTPANVFLTADCTGQAFSYHDMGFTNVHMPLAPLAEAPTLHIGNDLATGVSSAGPLFWVFTFAGFFSGPGRYDPSLALQDASNPYQGGVRVGDLPYQLDAFGVCAPLTTPGTIWGWIGADEQPVALAGLHDFVGPITRTLVPMPG